MKKMKLAVVFAAFVSVFSLSSCLNEGESGPAQLQWIVNVNEGSYGGINFTPDGVRGVKWTTDAVTLTQYGLPDGTKRALLTYTIPEGQNITDATKTLKVELVPGYCSAIPIAKISNRPDTLADYTSKIQEFTKFLAGVPAVYTNGRYLMINCTYQASELAKVGLVPNRISATNDTLYLDLKLKIKEGYKNGFTYYATNYDLWSYDEIYNMTPSNKDQDSIYVTVRALSADGGQEKIDSMTTMAIHRPY